MVLLVLDRVAALDHRSHHERRCTVELRRGLLACGLLELREGLGAEHAEAPRVREVVVRGPAGELEQLLEGLAVERRAAVRLVGPAGADRFVDLHPG